LREYTGTQPEEDRVHRVLQGAVPDVAYTDPGHGREMIVELKFINPGPTRCDTRFGREVCGGNKPY
jgi:hypothetical protein